jgi:glycosyltransferase involved in cell wall biosynthesis
VFLSPRKYDYLGLAALEAMACGKPVIAYNEDEGGEESKPVAKCGDNPLAWRETLATLVNDNDLRQVIGRESRAFIERNHTWQKTVDVMLDSIRTIIP